LNPFLKNGFPFFYNHFSPSGFKKQMKTNYEKTIRTIFDIAIQGKS